MNVAESTALINGRLYEAAYRKKLFFGSNGAVPVVTTVALATTYTGLALRNPATSSVNLVVERVGYSFTVAFGAASTIGLMGGYLAAGITAGIVAAEFPGAPTFVGNATTPSGVCAKGATLVGTPALLQVFGAGTALAIGSQMQREGIVNIGGSIIVPPGGWVAMYTSTASGAAAMAASFLWSEVPL